jgi:hypothetical protein
MRETRPLTGDTAEGEAKRNRQAGQDDGLPLDRRLTATTTGSGNTGGVATSR